jgi:predicted DNA-binding transcriptional regulator AlpA
MHDITDPILTDEEYRAIVNLSAPTTQRQRSDGSGPPFIQLSERRIGYRKSAVEQWLEARTINRVGALVSSAQALEPAAQADTPAPTPFDDAKAATKVEPPSGRRARRAGT